jgi:lysozyme family protein
MTDLNTLTAANAKRWANAKLTRGPEFAPVAERLAAPAAKARYQKISEATGVPWFVIAVIHEREASQDWTAQLGQGDPLGQMSTHVPKGRGPFFNHPDDPPLQDAFYRGALDALIDCAPYAARWKDWSPGGTMTLLEQYNGLGYANKGLPSPYIWSGTDQYRSGKYVRDGVFDPNEVDEQLGCAGLIKAMMEIDPTITFTGATLTVNGGSIESKTLTRDQLPPVPASPSVTNPAPGSLGALIASILAAIFSLFKRK